MNCPLAVLLVATACATPPGRAPASGHLISQGEDIARETCGECHAVIGDGPSPLADPPSFRALRRTFMRDQLAMLLTTRMAEIHPRMPKLWLDEDQAAALLDYLDRQP